MAETKTNKKAEKVKGEAAVPLNPQTTVLDFNGLSGAVALTLGLPLVVLFLYLCCNNDYVQSGPTIDIGRLGAGLQELLIDHPRFYLLNRVCWIAYAVWFFGLALMGLATPGLWIKGTKLRDGTSLWYLVNGKELTLFLVGIFACRAYYYGGLNLPELDFVYDNFAPLMCVTWLVSLLIATICYRFSFVPLRGTNGVGTKERILAVGGNSGITIFDWFIGRELNPRIGYWDIKLFCELRPGMLLWCLIDLACLQRQWHNLGGRVTNSIALVVFLQLSYIFDGVLNEEGVLSMMDITTDGFGFMLAFGDLCWVPFTYSLQARYLSYSPIDLPIWAVVVILAINALGFYIFKSSNIQKSQFKQGNLPDAKSIQTNTGSKLLCSGWWGMAQHINYLGDIFVALSWCLPTGFNTPLTYFYVIYFTALLLNRQQRDEAKCSKKYGPYWEQYQKEVPWRIVPYVY